MRILKSFVIGFSVYSRIPVPQSAWNEEDMRYMLCFFPWVGSVIGICIYLWNHICMMYSIGELCRTFFSAAIPLLITGGFHVDGFLDVMDACHSYQPKERKLEILRDPYIGAFAVIMFAVYGLLYLGAFSEIKDDRLIKIVCSGFFLSRCLCGISVLSLPLARQKGMLRCEADSARKKVVKIVLYLQAFACMGFMLFCSVAYGLVTAAFACLSFAWYAYCSRKEFGGITGDTSGYFVLLCEITIVVAAAFINISGIFMNVG